MSALTSIVFNKNEKIQGLLKKSISKIVITDKS